MDASLARRAKSFIGSKLRSNAEIPPTVFVATAVGIKAFPLSSTPLALWAETTRQAVASMHGYACILAASVRGYPGHPSGDAALLLHRQAGSEQLLFRPYTIGNGRLQDSGMWVDFHDSPKLGLLQGVLDGAAL